MNDLAPLALAQLESWERLARNWPVRIAAQYKEGEYMGHHLECVQCPQSVHPVIDTKHISYLTSLDIMTAGLVAHLRNVHRDYDPTDLEALTDGRQDEKASSNA